MCDGVCDSVLSVCNSVCVTVFVCVCVCVCVCGSHTYYVQSPASAMKFVRITRQAALQTTVPDPPRPPPPRVVASSICHTRATKYRYCHDDLIVDSAKQVMAQNNVPTFIERHRIGYTHTQALAVSICLLSLCRGSLVSCYKMEKG